jgi:hypothetical protein
MTANLEWQTLAVPPGHELVKGTEIAMAYVPGTQKRFAVCETRTVEQDRSLGMCYRLRDAATVSDADIRSGIRAKIISVHACPEAAVQAALTVLNGSA